jgi:predicted secreted protein
MSWVSLVAIYFVTWWMVLFVVLPFGVRNSAEAGTAVADGHDAGAPLQPQLLRKAKITTVLSAVVMFLGWALMNSGWIDIDTLPFYRDLPKLQ